MADGLTDLFANGRAAAVDAVPGAPPLGPDKGRCYMAATRTDANELARLQAVQARVRTLVREHRWFGDAIRAAFDDHATLVECFATEVSAMRDRERRLARKLLEDGRLFDTKARDNSLCLVVKIRGLCPVALAGCLGKYGPSDTMPRKLEQEGAAAALAALDRDAICQDRRLPAKTREKIAAEYRAALAAKTHVGFVWTIAVSRPAGWREPADPRSVNRSDLTRFVEADYRTIVLHRLGGLADVGALRPIVPQPTDTGDVVRDVNADLEWSARLPIEDDRGDPFQAPLSAGAFPADVAEQMLQDVEAWGKTEAARRDESLKGSGQSGSQELPESLPRAVAPVDPTALERVAERPAEKVLWVFGGGDHGGHARPSALSPGADESARPALTANQSRVLQTMARFDASRLLSSKMITEEMDAAVRLSDETVRQCVAKLVKLNLAERPEGKRSGARLNNMGRRLAGKIAD
jgi:hypothetical protein